MNDDKKTIVLIGCSGYIGQAYIEKFIALGLKVKVLARTPEKITKKFPEAEVIKGSLFNEDDVIKTMQNANAAFLITPIGPRNNKKVELDAATASINAAKKINFQHLIFVSVLIPEYPSGVALLDAKPEIENMIRDSGLPWTSIRCGTYMEDVIEHRIKNLLKGTYFFPVDKEKEFNLTCQADLPRFVDMLLKNNKILNAPIDFIESRNYKPDDIAALAGKALNRKVKASGKYPYYALLHLVFPILYLRKHRLSTIIPLIRFFNIHGYLGDTKQLSEVFPDFKMTTLEEYLERFSKTKLKEILNV